MREMTPGIVRRSVFKGHQPDFVDLVEINHGRNSSQEKL